MIGKNNHNRIKKFKQNIKKIRSFTNLNHHTHIMPPNYHKINSSFREEKITLNLSNALKKSYQYDLRINEY